MYAIMGFRSVWRKPLLGNDETYTPLSPAQKTGTVVYSELIFF